MEKPPPQQFFKLYFILILLSLFYFSGCSDIAPQLLFTDVKVVFDYQTEDSEPLMHLSVFVQPDATVRKLDKVVIMNEETDYEWQVDNPEVFTNKKKEWAGYADLEPCDSEVIPTGKYLLKYIDLNGSTSESDFDISYDSKFLSSKSSDIENLLGTGLIKKIAIYDKDNILLYYDEYKEEWIGNDEEIWKDYSTAESYRTYFISNDEKIICLLPAVYRTDVPSTSADQTEGTEE